MLINVLACKLSIIVQNMLIFKGVIRNDICTKSFSRSVYFFESTSYDRLTP